MRILVCGGRNFYARDLIEDTLDALSDNYQIDSVVTGAATGVDEIAHQWALETELTSICVSAKWADYKDRAGPIRNAEMIDKWKPDLVVAFPGGKGTANMVKLAKEAGVEVIEIAYDKKLA